MFEKPILETDLQVNFDNNKIYAPNSLINKHTFYIVYVNPSQSKYILRKYEIRKI